MSVQDIQTLRKETGAGIVAVKKALDEAGGDIEKARSELRKQGMSVAMKKGDRDANDGKVVSYLHPGDKIGVLLVLNCETDFVAQTQEFQQLGRDIAMHIAAMSPQFVARTDVPADVANAEGSVYRAQMEQESKPADVIEKIIEGKMEKFYQSVVLLEQAFIKDTDKTIQQCIEEVILKLGEKITVGEFTRYEI